MRVTRVMMLSPEREFATGQAWQVVAPFVIQWSSWVSYAVPGRGVLSVSDILEDVQIDADNILSRGHNSGLEHLAERDRFWGESAKNVSRMGELAPPVAADTVPTPDARNSKTYRTGSAVLAPLRLIGIHRLIAASRKRREERRAALLESLPVPDILAPDISVALIDLEQAVEAIIRGFRLTLEDG